MAARKPNHTCKVCGKAYYACNACDQMRSWRAMCDTPEHYQIYQTLILYTRRMIDKFEAASMLDSVGVDLEQLGNFTPSTADLMWEILQTEDAGRD